jgi:hypothetical protein
VEAVDPDAGDFGKATPFGLRETLKTKIQTKNKFTKKQKHQ